MKEYVAVYRNGIDTYALALSSLLCADISAGVRAEAQSSLVRETLGKRFDSMKPFGFLEKLKVRDRNDYFGTAYVSGSDEDIGRLKEYLEERGFGTVREMPQPLPPAPTPPLPDDCPF